MTASESTIRSGKLFQLKTIEIVAGICLSIAASMLSLHFWSLLGETVFSRALMDVWFDSDSPRVYQTLTHRTSQLHYRTNVHPLFSLFVALPTISTIKVAGISPLLAVQMGMALVAALVAGILFFLLLRITGYLIDAIIYVCLFLSSGAFLFWFSVAETYAWGALSILIVFALVSLNIQRGKFLISVAANTISASMTITNAMAGLAATLVSWPLCRVVQICVYSFAVVAFLSVVQVNLFPSASFLRVIQERHYIAADKPAAHLPSTFTTFFINSVVLPEIIVKQTTHGKPKRILSVQSTAIGSGGIASFTAAIAWVGLLVLGLRGAIQTRPIDSFRRVLFLTIAGQLILHLLYGNSTFLYAAHFVPLLVLLSGFASRTSVRLPALALALIVVVAGGWSNKAAFTKSAELLPIVGSDGRTVYPRTEVLAHIRERPDDPWPRGEGHVVLGSPGSAELEKAYLEPGGSFSPSVGSFGLSIWVLDEKGSLLETSDDIPIVEISHSFVRQESGLPAVSTSTSHYTTVLKKIDPSVWELAIQPGTSGKDLVLAVRSVGPAGSAIKTLKLDNDSLWVNDRWRLGFSPITELLFLGEEGQENWTEPISDLPEDFSIRSESGWAHARLAVSRNSGLNVRIVDTKIDQNLKKTERAKQALSQLSYTPEFGIRDQGSGIKDMRAVSDIASALELDLPDERFVSALEAQVAHLTMGLVGDETRPGDPMSYPLAWQRDGSYVIAALTKAGRMDLARRLAPMLAEVDFFGGFGAEGDAPGLALWAIAAVSKGLNDQEFDNLMWPDVRRKADLILSMLTSPTETRANFYGPVSPSHRNEPNLYLISKPAQDGLIVGHMDWHFPKLYVSAVSYRGLMDAAGFARRIGACKAAELWLSAAVELREDWARAFKGQDLINRRTLASAIWPTFVAQDFDALEAALEFDWDQRRTDAGDFKERPLWTYFEIAKAHQWIKLGKPKRAWQTMEWFWDSSPAPGLFTLWEGSFKETLPKLGGEGGGLALWDDIRGWVKPPNITPHYWAAAEMLMLQLSVLAYVEQAQDKPILVIGAGVPKDWLMHPLRVGNINTDAGTVSWSWDGNTVRIDVQDEAIEVRLGPAFPDRAVVQVHSLQRANRDKCETIRSGTR